MIMSMRAVVLSWLLSGSTAFVVSSSPTLPTRLYNAVGGWGIGQSRELTDGEMVNRGERRSFDGYQLKERGDFLKGIQDDRAQMAKDEIAELLGVAKMAGIDVKDPNGRLNKFDDDDWEEEYLDVSVQWEEEDKMDVDKESITRMDEDTGAPGVW